MPEPEPPPELPSAPPAAERLPGDTLSPLTEYGRLLATDGVIRGLIGPREVPRLWDRHLLNCAALAESVPSGARVADIGTGAGLPGLVLAIIRPDLSVVLIETLQRRCDFLREAVDHLALGKRVTIVRGRAEQVAPTRADVVTSRAVAALDTLATWCLPHARIGGMLLAIKGERAAEELETARPILKKWGADADARIITCGEGWIDPPVRAVQATRKK